MTSLPATDKLTRAAGELLGLYGFTRETIGGIQQWRRTSGAFLVRLMVSPSGRAALRLSTWLQTGGWAPPRPWSVGLPPEPWPLAVEAVLFVCTAEGLTPPRLVGNMAGPGTTT